MKAAEEDVNYFAPVSVTVNTETGKVVRVVVLDEDVALSAGDKASPAARAIAENEEWPDWEIGL